MGILVVITVKCNFNPYDKVLKAESDESGQLLLLANHICFRSNVLQRAHVMVGEWTVCCSHSLRYEMLTQSPVDSRERCYH